MDFDDYESLPSCSPGAQMIAGAVAGVMEHCVMFPVDSVKTRMQSLSINGNAGYGSIRAGLRMMISNEGMMRPLRGMNVVVVGAGPAHALYFSAYEHIKKYGGTSQPYQGFLVNAAAGCGATLLHDAVMVPVDVVKQRMQMFNSPFSSCYNCIKEVLKTEGVSAFYRSYTTQLAMNIPFHAIHIAVYEKLQEILNAKRDYDPKTHMISGALAGGIASAVTTPFDMAKTVLNIQESQIVKQNHQSYIKGLLPAMKTIYLVKGIPGYFRGIQARVLYQMPGTAISWSVYELFKFHLSKAAPDDDGDPSPNADLINDLVAQNVDDMKPTIDASYANKAVERLKHLPMPSTLTANCAPKKDSLINTFNR